MAHGAVAEGRAAGQIGDVADVRRSHDALVIGGHVHEDPVQVDVLLGVGADQVVKGMAGDGQHRLAVHLGIIKAVEQMDAAGAGSGQADAEPAGVLGIGAGHEGGRFLVAHLDEADLVLALAQRFHDAVDAVAGEAKDDFHSPVHKRSTRTSAVVRAILSPSIPCQRRRWCAEHGPRWACSASCMGVNPPRGNLTADWQKSLGKGFGRANQE